MTSKPMANKPYIILASQSPRRKMLLEKQGYDFEVIPSLAEEIDASFDNVTQIVVENARLKGTEVLNRLGDRYAGHPQACVLLACDTLVAMDSRVFPKPRNLEQAHEFLQTMGGRKHQVYSGVFLHHIQSGKEIGFFDETIVTLRVTNQSQRDALFKKVNPLDKAGAYGAQNSPEILAALEGHISNVIGLPTEALAIQLDILLGN